MRIIHTGDWHLGQSFYDYDRKTEHLRFLTWLKGTVSSIGIDVLLIAGDIFDSPNPSAESQKVYYSFLREITNENPDLQVIIIAGNHDSAARLEAPNPLLESMNVSVKGLVKRTTNGDIDYENLIVPLNAGGYCLAVPYLRQGDYPEAENYAASVKMMYDRLYEIACELITGHASENDRPSPILAMGHLHVAGSEISENDRSERTVIGGLENVLPDAFCQGIAYTALGHLHRGQKASGHENVRYSGAPIPMSFAEKNNRQGVVLVEIKNEQAMESRYSVHIERIEYDGAIRLLSIPQELMTPDEVLREIQKLPHGDITDESPYLEIKTLITEPEPALRHRIEEALKGKAVRLARITAVMQAGTSERKAPTLEELQAASPMDIAEKVFERKYGGEKLPETMKKLLLEVIKEVER